MACLTPFVVKRSGPNSDVPVPCGRCPFCRARRASGWSFRLRKEAEVSTSAHFLTLTYAPESVPITPNGFMTLSKVDVQKFFKRLRKLNPMTKIKYYAVGEYGGRTRRPHYHIILFNANLETYEMAWRLDDKQIGQIYVGACSVASVGYTLKYISKSSWRPLHDRDDRLPLFSLMSKGLGVNYVTEEVKKWHLKDLERCYITIEDGKKIALPRYYKERIYSEEQAKAVSFLAQQRAANDKTKGTFQEYQKAAAAFERQRNNDKKIDKL